MIDNPSPILPEDQELTQEQYDQTMVDKFDEQLPSDDRPQWLPEKFKSPEDLAKAYGELEKKLSQPKAQETAPAPDTDDVRERLESEGFDLDALSQKYAEKGDLDEQDYEDLKARGITRDMVSAYAEGQRALAERLRTEVLSTVGVEETYDDMVQWAAQSLSPAEIAAYNAAVNSGDMGMVKLAVTGLTAQYNNAVGTEPTFVSGKTGVASVDSYRSTAEVTRAMADPRYKSDPAYRQDVANKLNNSPDLF
jgi:hypothetical protein